jgi:hypothetical protein
MQWPPTLEETQVDITYPMWLLTFEFPSELHQQGSSMHVLLIDLIIVFNLVTRHVAVKT